MTAFELLFYSLLFALSQGQAPANRSQNWRQWVRERNISSGAPQNSEGEAPVNGSQNRRQWAHEVHQMESGALQNASADEERVSEDSSPETWRDLLVMRNVTDISSFLTLLVTAEGQPVRAEDIFVPSESEDGKLVISGSGDIMAEPDECSPRNTTVRLDVDVEDPQVVYYPDCTRVERCGGCTPASFLACVPVYKENIVVSVLKARYPYPRAVSMRMEGFAPVLVERHLSCRIACTLRAEDCGENSVYLEEQCRCSCKSRQSCGNNKVWSEDTCQCRCRVEFSCCGPREENGRRCPMYFDPVFCECTLKESVGGAPNASQAEMEVWLASRRSRRPSNAFFDVLNLHNATQPAPQPNTTTSTTTTSTTTQASCARFRCPRYMQSSMTASGRCLCQFPENSGRPERHG